MYSLRLRTVVYFYSSINYIHLTKRDSVVNQTAEEAEGISMISGMS